jgi:O-antigen/teichoic acid export membrane protein
MPWNELILTRPRVLREATWITLAQLLGAVARLALLRILTDLLSPREYGHLALLLGAAALVTGTLLSPILQANIRFYVDAARIGRINAMRRLARRLLWACSSLATILVLAGGWLWSRVSSSGVAFSTLVLLAVMILVEAFRIFEADLLGVARRQLLWSAWTTLDAWARPLGAVIAIALFGPTVDAVLIGYSIGTVASSGPFLPRTVRGTDIVAGGAADSWIDDTRPRFLRFALPLVPMALLTWIVNLSDRYILGGTAGAASVGEYAASYGLGSMPFVFLAGIGISTLRPILFDAVAAGDREKERRTILAWLVAIGVPAVLAVGVVFVFSESIARLALGEAFWGAAGLLPWIAAAYALQAIQQIFETMIHAQQRTHRLMVLQLVSAATALALYAVLIPSWGARGAAVATFVSFAVSCMTSVFLAGAPKRLLMGGK